MKVSPILLLTSIGIIGGLVVGKQLFKPKPIQTYESNFAFAPLIAVIPKILARSLSSRILMKTITSRASRAGR